MIQIQTWFLFSLEIYWNLVSYLFWLPTQDLPRCQCFGSFCKKTKQKQTFNEILSKNETPKYGLHFVLPCHLQVPLSFQALIVKKSIYIYNLCPFLSLLLLSLCPNTSDSQRTVTLWACNFSSAQDDQSPAAPSKELRFYTKCFYSA